MRKAGIIYYTDSHKYNEYKKYQGVCLEKAKVRRNRENYYRFLKSDNIAHWFIDLTDSSETKKGFCQETFNSALQFMNLGWK